MKNIFKNWFKKIKPCNHEWECATIHQVRVENGKLVPFMMKTPQLLECKKCKKTKRVF